MKHFKLEQSNADIISHSGLALVGQAINKQTRAIQSSYTYVRPWHQRCWMHQTINGLNVLLKSAQAKA